MSIEKARKILKAHWGYDQFRPAQEEVLAHIFEGNDVLAVLPTSYGKSLLYQIPAVMSAGCALVISPLIALMKDQCDDATARDVPVSYVNSHVSDADQKDRLERFAKGEYSVFYVSPERLQNRKFVESLKGAGISYLAVDECHPAGTRITMEDGSQKEVEAVREGDVVLSRSEDRRFTRRRVSRAGPRPLNGRRMLSLVTNNGYVLATADHRVYLDGRGYVPAEEVREGEWMARWYPRGRGGFIAFDYVEEVIEVPAAADEPVYALEVEADHCYFANGLLVHNCHSVSMDGPAFRPAYRRIKEILPYIAYQEGGQWYRPPILAFTATATAAIADDIAENLGMHSTYKKVVADPIRANLAYRVCRDAPVPASLREFFAGVRGKGRYVVYAGTQKGAQEQASIVSSVLGHGTTAYYHAGLDKRTRETVQDAFKEGVIRVVVATSAFGMGIDVPDIRGVVNAGIPGSLEAYSQMSGRAGRDGLHSECFLIHDPYVQNLQQTFLEWENPEYAVYERAWAWLHANSAKGDLISMGLNKMALAMKGGVSANAVGSVLATMHAYGLVHRSPVPYGLMAELKVKPLLDAVTTATKLTPNTRAVAAAMWEQFKAMYKPPYPDHVEFGVDKTSLAEAAGVSSYMADKAVKELAEKALIEPKPGDYSKTTTVLRYGEKLEDLLPEGEVARKRDVAQERLDAMVAYTELPHGKHVGFIRKYFTGE